MNRRSKKNLKKMLNQQKKRERKLLIKKMKNLETLENIRFYDFSSELFNQLLDQVSNDIDMVENPFEENSIIMLKDSNQWYKYQILTNEEYNSLLSEENNITVQELSREEKFDQLLRDSDKLGSKLNDSDLPSIYEDELFELYNEMISVLSLVISSNYYNLSAYYNNLGMLSYILLHHFNNDLENVEDHFKSAIDTKPDNQSARIWLIQHYIRLNYFTTALRYILELESTSTIDKFLTDYINTMITNYDQNLESNHEALKLVEKFKSKTITLSHLELLLQTIFHDFTSIELSYNLLIKQIIREIKKDKGVYNINSLQDVLLSIDVNISNRLGSKSNYNEREKEKIIKILEKSETHFKEYKRLNSYDYQKFLTNKAGLYLLFEDYNRVIKILSSKKTEKLNNADYSNLAFANFYFKDYKRSYEYALKAYTIQIDEQILYLLCQLSFIDHDYSKANNYALESYAYLTKLTDGVNEFTDINGRKTISIAGNDVKKADFLKKLIIIILNSNKYYHFSLNIIDKHLKQYSFDPDYIILKRSVEKQIENDKNSQNKFKEIEKEYVIVQEELDKKMAIQNKMKNIFKEFISLQKIETEIEMNDENLHLFLDNVQGQLKDIVSSKYNPGINQKTKKLRNKLKNCYNNFQDISIEFISTAEALYEDFDNADIDYGLIAVAYGKVIEMELDKLLKKEGHTHIELRHLGKTSKQKINWNRGLMLAQSRDLLRKNPVIDLENIDQMIEEIRIARNKSAHTGECRLDTILNVRRYLYDEKWLKKLNSML